MAGVTDYVKQEFLFFIPFNFSLSRLTVGGKKRIFACTVIFKLFIVEIKVVKCYSMENICIFKIKESGLKMQ
jgi:hypothetical protein